MEPREPVAVSVNSMPVDGPKICTGNANHFVGSVTKGWFIGSFIDEVAGPRRTSDLEVKWCSHNAGEERYSVSQGGRSTSLAILVSGSFQFFFPGTGKHAVTLRNQGDYVLYGEGVAHTWRALLTSTVITVRWPSCAG